MKTRRATSRSRPVWSLTSGLVAILALLPIAGAQEQVPRTIPYDGLLRLGDAALSGEAGMRFTLEDEAGSTLWSEEYSAQATKSCGTPADMIPCLVAVYDGHFSVALGQHVPLEDWVLDAEPLYLSIEVLNGLDQWVPLDNRQLLTPVPYSLWSMQATDMVVDGDLSVGVGGIDVYGQLDTPSLSTDGTLTVDRSLSSAGTVSVPTMTATGGAGTISLGGVIWVDSANVLGDIQFYDDGAYAATAAHWNSDTDQLEIGADASALRYTVGRNGLLTFSGNTTFESTVYVEDTQFGNNLYTTSRPPVQIFFFDFSGNSASIGLAYADYWCWIGGWHFDGTATMNDGGGTNPVRVHTYSNSGIWRVSMDVSSTGEHEGHEVAVICVDRAWVNRADTSWFN